ncbi:MAG TPA: hypothetical protein VG603_05455 [Chitinophagales bacterium]|nr:hypothetical protein [Chitinophagales bacterium]
MNTNYSEPVPEITHPENLFADKSLIITNRRVDNAGTANNRYKLAFVFFHPQQQLPPNLLEMLEKLAAACQFKPGEFLLFNSLPQTNVTLGSVMQNYHPGMVLLFGDVLMHRNMAPLKRNTPYWFGETLVIKTETLEKLATNSAEKLALWNLLKKVLSI